MENNELKHYGVLGMKWGQRRYQSKDGSLTPAGKKRYSKEVEKIKSRNKVLTNQIRTKKKLDKLEDMKKNLKNKESQLSNMKTNTKTSSTKTKKISEMSNEELQTLYNRLQLEKNVRDLLPKDTAKGKKLVDRFKDASVEVVSEAAKDVGKQLVKSAMTSAVNKTFNLDDDLKVYTNNKKKN